MLSAAPLFTDHMVLQREKEIVLWGTARDGARVVAEIAGLRAASDAANGSWRLALPAAPAGGPHRLAIAAGGESIVFEDVWFGDVWLAGGQSNMEWPLSDSSNGEAEIAASGDYPLIRYYDVPKVAYDDGIDRPSAWRISGPETSGRFSAVAYHFAKRVHAQTGVPIGILGCNMGATSASCWVPEETLERDGELRIYLDEFRALVQDFDWTAYEAAEKAFHAAFEAHQAAERAGTPKEVLGPVPWPPPMSPKSFMRPNGLYGTMLKPAAPYTLKGFLYYQGESDAHRPLLYDRLLEALILHWRELWSDDRLPFLFVQLTSFGCDGNPHGEEWAMLRESQALVAERVPNTAMAVTLDCGERDDIHPREKRTVGERLAMLALEDVYGILTHCTGPVFQAMKADGDGKAKLFFRCGGELRTIDGAPPAGFELCGPDMAYAPADARIDGHRVVLRSERVTRPVAARYGWANDPGANLADSFGLPAAPFRTNREGR